MNNQNIVEALSIMNKNFGKDTLISLATCVDNIPHSRTIGTYFEDGYFYTITYALSNKMKQISENPIVAISNFDWFSGHGIAENLGYIYNDENMEIAEKLKVAFAEWYYNGHNDYEDKNTIILRIKLTDCKFFHNDKAYCVDFSSL